MRRVGLVGCGGTAVRHLEGYRRVLAGRAEVVAVCDPAPGVAARFAAERGVERSFEALGDLLDGVDVVSVLTPAAVRDEVILSALERGVHLLVEKPFAADLESARRYVDAAERVGLHLAVNQQMRFMPEAQTAQALIADGALGELVHLEHDVQQRRTVVRGWRREEQRLEISIFSIHILDRLRGLAGRPATAVTAVTRQLNPEVRGETYTALTIQFEGGAVATMVSNWHALELPEARLRIDGTAGSLWGRSAGVAGDQGELCLQRDGGAAECLDWQRPDNFTLAFGESMARLLDRRTRRGAGPPGRDNLQTMATSTRISHASRDGELVRRS